MKFYICSCGLLLGERRDAFDQFCKLKGHNLFEVDAELYAVVYSFRERNIKLKETVRKRNRDIARLREKLKKRFIEQHIGATM